MKLADYRSQYPQYNDMSDADLASALHSKFYSDMPVADFNTAIGLSTPSSSKPATKGLGGITAGLVGKDGEKNSEHGATGDWSPDPTGSVTDGMDGKAAGRNSPEVSSVIQRQINMDRAQKTELKPGAKISNPAQVGWNQGIAGLRRIGAGITQVAADVTGSRTLEQSAADQRTRANEIEGAAVLRGDPIKGFAGDSIVQELPQASANAIGSIIQTAPALAAGAVAPGAALPAIFANSAAQEYGEGRDAGLSVGKAAIRAPLMGAMEVIGEKIGGTKLIAEALNKVGRKNGVLNLANALLKSSAKEIPGEVTTTTGQILVDMLPEVGLNPDITLDDYKMAVKDTVLATAMQSGGMALTGKTMQAVTAIAAIKRLETDGGITRGQALQAVREIDKQMAAEPEVKADVLNDRIKAELANAANPGAVDTASMDQAIEDAALKEIIGNAPEALPAADVLGEENAEQAAPTVLAGQDGQSGSGDGIGSTGTGVLAEPSGLVMPESVPAITQQAEQGEQRNIPDGPASGVADPAVAARFKGDAIDDEWTSFADQSGTLKIPRAEMPQILAEHRGAMVNFLNARGIAHEQAEVPAAELKPTQAEFSQAKVDKASKREGGTRSILVSEDSHVLDGHHQWLAAVEKGESVPVIRLKAPIQQLLQDVREFPSLEQSTGGVESQQQPDAVIPASAPEAPAQADMGNPISGVTPIIDRLVKRRAAAVQIGKRADFDTAMATAKKLAEGQVVKPSTFARLQRLFTGKDQQLADLMGELLALAKAPASAERKTKKERLEQLRTDLRAAVDAGNQAEVRKVMKDAQSDKSLTDRDLEALDDIAASLEEASEDLTDDEQAALDDAIALAEQVLGADAVTAIDAEVTGRMQGMSTADIERELTRVLNEQGQFAGVREEAGGERSGQENEQPAASEQEEGDQGTGKKVEPEILTFEQFASRNNASRAGIGEAALHKTSANKSPNTHKRQVIAQAMKDDELIARRAELQRDYDRLVEAGEIRPPTSKESVIATANGHPDNQATQAARRLAAKKGWDWKQKQTDTPEFRSWFGKSKVVDEKGEPLAMFHGTSASQQGEAFTQFDTYASNYGLMGMGGYFTADPSVASSYTSKGKGDSPSVYKVYLSIKNPLDMDAEADTQQWIDQFEDIENYHEGGDTNESWYRAAEESIVDQEVPKWEGAEIMQDGLRSMGFDGITHIGGGRVKADSVNHRVYIAFDPEQIKSATGNQGNFDPSNPDIRMSRGAGQPMPLDRVESFVNAIASRWENAPDIVVVQDMADSRIRKAVRDENERQLSQGASGQPEGFFDNGKVYIVASEMTSPGDAMRVLYHEALGHYGLRGAFGDALKPVLTEVAALRRTDVLAKAKEYGLDFNNEADRRLAAEEVLAEMAERNPKATLVQRAIAAIKAWMRKHVPGFADMRLTDADIISQFLVPAQNFVRNSLPIQESGLAFSRKSNQSPNGWQSPDESKLDDVIYQLQDKHIDLKRVQQNIKDATSTISDRWDAYLQEELYHGRSASRTQDFIKDELDPLIADMRAKGVSMAEFEEYLWNRHAEERNLQIAKINDDMPDAGSGISTKDAREYLAGLTPAKQKAYAALAARVDAINKKSRQILVDYGLESADTIKAWEDAYKNYVPLMREDMDLGGGMGTGQGFSIKGSSAKRATGSKLKVVDILANIAQQRERNIIRGEKNRVATALVGLAKLNPNRDLWETDNPPKRSVVVPAKNVYEVHFHGSKVDEFPNRGAANNFITYHGKPGMTVEPVKVPERVEEQVDPTYKNKDNVIVARVPQPSGEIVEHAVLFNLHNERAMRMAASIKGLDQDQLHRVLGWMSQITRFFSSINTQYNPIFGMVNFTRDLQGAALNLSTTDLAGSATEILSNTPSALRGIYRELRGKQSKNQWASLWDEFKSEGGQTGYRDQYRNAKVRGEALEHALDPEWWASSKAGKIISANGVLKKPEQLMLDKAVKPVFDWLSDYNEAIENSVRLAAYKAGLDQGMTKQRAASLAKNLTVNFNRKGALGRELGSMYAFFNAAIQGTARIAETLAGPAGKKIVLGGLSLGVLQAVVLQMAGFDDEEPPEFVKDKNIIIPTGNGKFISIPMPLGFNALPSISRIVMEQALSDRPEPAKAIGHILEMLLDVTNPIGGSGNLANIIMPTFGDPIVDLARNRDFSNREIAKRDFSSLSPTPGFTRGKNTASAFGDMVSEAINTVTGGTDYKPGWFSPTPDQIDYLAGQLTGGVGREALKVQQSAMAAANDDLGNLPIHKWPVLGRFYGDAKGPASVSSAFYRNVELLNIHENEVKGRRRNRGDVQGYFQEFPEARLIGLGNASYTQVQKLKKQLQGKKEADAPKEEIKRLENLIQKQMTRLNDRVKQKQSAKEPKAA